MGQPDKRTASSPETGMRSYTYKLAPTAKQIVSLFLLLRVQRELYNAGLEERRTAWRRCAISRSRIDQFKELTEAMAELPELAFFGLQVARGTLWRLDRAFAAFFRRVKNGETPGFPRFKGAERFDSVSWPEPVTWKVKPSGTRHGRLYVKGVGHVKIRLHRELRGEARTLTICRQGRTWQATIQARGVPLERQEPTGRSVGVDRGVCVLAACSDGTLVENPRHLKRSEERLEAAQQVLAKRRRGSRRRLRARAEVSRLHHKVARQRRDTLHQLSRLLVDRYDTVAIERLSVSKMTRSARGTIDRPGRGVAQKAGLNRAILDSGWGMLQGMLGYKAAGAGRRLVIVDPANTSITCSACGHRHRDDRISQDTWRCCRCATVTNADLNAAINIADRAGLARDDTTSGATPYPVVA